MCSALPPAAGDRPSQPGDALETPRDLDGEVSGERRFWGLERWPPAGGHRAGPESGSQTPECMMASKEQSPF